MMSDYANQPCHGLTPLAPTGAPKPPPGVLPWPIPSVPPFPPSGPPWVASQHPAGFGRFRRRTGGAHDTQRTARARGVSPMGWGVTRRALLEI